MCAVMLAVATLPARAKVTPPTVEEFRLDNGLEVVFVRSARVPVVTVQVWYKVGTRDEPNGRRGMARFFERLMFQGSTRVKPGDHARLLDDLGGSVAAFTTEDATVMQETVPSGYLDFVLELEADRMRGLVLRDSARRAELAILKEDRARKVDQDPVGLIFARLRELAFAAHPYASTPPGDPDELDKVTLDELRKMYDTYFVPNNAVLVIVGDATLDEVKASVERHFKALPAGKAPPSARRGEAILPPAKPVAEELGRGEVGFLARASHLPPMKSDDIFALRVLAGVLGGEGQGARLPALIIGKGAGDYATAQVDTHQDGGLFLMMAEYVDPTKRDVLVRLFDEEVKRLIQDGVTPTELERGKNQLAAILAGSLEDTSGMAFHVGSAKVFRGDAKAWLGDLDRYLAVTNDDIKRVAKTYLGGDKATLVVMTPGGGR